MPTVDESPARLSRVLPVALLAHLCTGAWLTSASVYYSAIPQVAHIGPAVASAAIGLSYLVSILLAGRTSLRDLRIALGLLAAGLFIQSIWWPWCGSAIFVIGLGLMRPAMIGVVGRSDPSRLRAFQRYTIVINLGYLLGGVLADAVRFSAGYAWLLFGMGSLAIVALLASIWLGPSESVVDPDEPASSTPMPIALALLASVAMFYFVMSLVSTIFSVVAEGQTSLKAGSLGGLHGAMVLVIMLALLAKPPSVDPVLSLLLGLCLWAVALGGLAATHAPIPLSVLVAALAVMSLGESVILPNLMTLGSRLAGFGTTAYWAAATLGFWGSMVYNLGWLGRGQAKHFGYVALACGVAALAMGLLRRRP